MDCDATKSRTLLWNHANCPTIVGEVVTQLNSAVLLFYY